MDVVKTLQALDKVEVTSSRLEKIAILREADQGLLRRILYMTYNPFLVYHMTLPSPIKLGANDHVPLDASNDLRSAQWDKFFCCLEAGPVKDDMVEFLGFQSVHDAKWMTRVLNRDLKAGIAVSTMEVLFGKKCIPTFDVQLANPYKGQTFSKPRYVEPKYDGLRGVAFRRHGGPWEFLSRSGKPFWNTEQVAKALTYLGFDDVVLDGEFFGEDWNTTQSVLLTQIRPKGGPALNEFVAKLEKLTFYVFDLVPLTDWEAGVCRLTQAERLAKLDEFFQGKPSTGFVAQG